MPQFQPGDRVRRTRNDYVAPWIQNGEVYTILTSDTQNSRLVEDPSPTRVWNNIYFELITSAPPPVRKLSGFGAYAKKNL